MPHPMFAYVRLFASRHLGPSPLGSGPLASLLRAVLEPRKPRHRVLRFLLGLAGVALLAVLVVVGVAVGAVMLTLGLGYRLLTRGARPAAAKTRVVEGQYRVVTHPVLPASR
jgi:hypothetical protein